MSLNGYELLMRAITFYNINTVRADFLEDRFPRIRWFLTTFYGKCAEVLPTTKFVVIDETLRNFYVSYNCNFKVYMKDKPGNYGLLFRVLADAQDRYSFRVTP